MDAEPGSKPPSSRIGPWPWQLAAIAGLAVLATLGDPGITSDEPIDVKVGRNYLRLVGLMADRAGREGLGAIGRAQLDALFADNAQHPPLGRWLLGLASAAFEPLEVYLGGPDAMSVHAARIAPMLAFAGLVGLVASEAGRRYGKAAGIVSGASLLLMPRVFAHAHFATLDTFLSLFWTLALFGAARGIDSRRPVAATAAAGALWGLALLTKIHAWLLPPLVVGYAMARLPMRKASGAVALWGLVGILVFVAGWPWLWFDPADRLSRFLSTSVERQAIPVRYFGRVVADRDLPWHYPWFYFAATVPIGLQALGAVGIVRGVWKAGAGLASRKGRAEPPDLFPGLMLASIVLFLSLFSTGAPVYDGERLFVLVFPAWAVLIGLGFKAAWEGSRRRWLRGLLIAFVVAQGVGVARMHPFQLSYYNAIVGGLPGAERLGLELTYWGDTIDGRLLAEAERIVPPGEPIALAPTFHHLHPLAVMSPGLYEQGSMIRPEEALGDARWLLVFRRSALWSPEVREALERGRPVALRSRRGVWLAGLWRLDREPPAFSGDNREDPFRMN